MEIPEKMKDLAVSETGFVFDPYTGASFNTNAVGYAILEALRSGKGRRDIRSHLEDEFEVGEADVDRDIDEFIFLLKDSGVLPPSFTLEEL